MTMLVPNAILTLPNPNDPTSIIAHRQAVLEAHAPLFNLVNAALEDSIPKATNTFKLYGGPVDLGVHAGNTRYLTKLFLGSENIAADYEEASDYEMQHVANCGLCLQWKSTEIRILKATPAGLPKASSKARLEFYSSNQMNLGFEAGAVGEKSASYQLRLVLLWALDPSHKYAGLQIACPRKVRKDGNVDCFWITDWNRSAVAIVKNVSNAQKDSDLEEIRPVQSQTKAAK
jgi:hypothetical protein